MLFNQLLFCYVYVRHLYLRFLCISCAQKEIEVYLVHYNNSCYVREPFDAHQISTALMEDSNRVELVFGDEEIVAAQKRKPPVISFPNWWVIPSVVLWRYTLF